MVRGSGPKLELARSLGMVLLASERQAKGTSHPDRPHHSSFQFPAHGSGRDLISWTNSRSEGLASRANIKSNRVPLFWGYPRGLTGPSTPRWSRWLRFRFLLSMYLSRTVESPPNILYLRAGRWRVWVCAEIPIWEARNSFHVFPNSP